MSVSSYLHSCCPPIVHGYLTCDTIFIQHNGLVKIGSGKNFLNSLQTLSIAWPSEMDRIVFSTFIWAKHADKFPLAVVYKLILFSVAPDTIHHHVKTCRDKIKNVHFIAPEYGGNID